MAWPFIWIKINSLQLMMLCAKFGWNWPIVSVEEDFYNLRKFVSAIYLSSPHGKGLCPSFEQTWISFNKWCFVPNLKFAQWFWRRRWKCEKFITTRTSADNLFRKVEITNKLSSKLSINVMIFCSKFSRPFTPTNYLAQSYISSDPFCSMRMKRKFTLSWIYPLTIEQKGWKKMSQIFPCMQEI